MDDELELKENISRMSDEKLLEMVTTKSNEYREAALYFAKNELKARRIDFITPAADESSAASEPPIPSIDSHGLVQQCLACGGRLRFGTLVAEKELSIIFSDNDEERFVRVTACSQCGNVSLTVDYENDVQK